MGVFGLHCSSLKAVFNQNLIANDIFVSFCVLIHGSGMLTTAKAFQNQSVDDNL